MRTQAIRNMIQNAIVDEQTTGRLANTVISVARGNGINLTKQQVNAVLDFVREYILHVPFYLEEGYQNAQQVGLSEEIYQMMAVIEEYWFREEDVIPDHYGLAGILDDAYASLQLIQSFSDFSKQTRGYAILNQDLKPANQWIRAFIGEPAVSILDQSVGLTLATVVSSKILNQLYKSNFNFGVKDPIWGNATTEEIANARMGALGIV